MTMPVLFVGGMDSSGGAGLLRDTATAAGLGVPARVAVTAVTAQNTRAVQAVHPVPPRTVAAQIALACADGIGAVKLGMLGTGDIVRAVARELPEGKLVLDPVLVSSSGSRLIDDQGIDALIDLLLPRVRLLTPNLPELRALAGRVGLPPGTQEQAIVRALQARGCGAVLVKGGHGDPGRASTDRLYDGQDRVIRFSAPRWGFDLRGTGCQLASGIACYLARGVPLARAAALGHDLVQARFAAAA